MFEQKGNLLIHPIKNVSRLKTILTVFAKNGFSHFLQKAGLGRYIMAKISSKARQGLTTEEQLRLSFEELGPTFVKLGQLLATRPDLIPLSFCNEFKKLHDQTQTTSFEKVEPVLVEEFKKDLNSIFKNIDTIPIGSASIAQVYQAELLTGESVVIKVQKPGIESVIKEDLDILYFIAKTLESYLPELSVYNPVGIVDEFFKTMQLETDFIVEANNIERFQNNFKSVDNIKIPKFYRQFTTKKVLVLEQLKGTALSQSDKLNLSDQEREGLIKAAIQGYFKMVFHDGFFHGDMHPGNIFILSDNSLGLIDFGVVGRLNHKTKSSITNMLIALAHEDYERLALEYIELAPYSENASIDRLSRQLRDLIAPYFGLSLDQVNTGRLLLNSTSIVAKQGITLPAELILFFKSIVTIEGLGRMLKKDFDVLFYALEFSQDILSKKYEPESFVRELTEFSRDSSRLLQQFPVHIKNLLRKWNSPKHSHKVKLEGMDEFLKVQASGFKAIAYAIIIGFAFLSASLLQIFSKQQDVLGLSWSSFFLYILSFALLAMTIVR